MELSARGAASKPSLEKQAYQAIRAQIVAAELLPGMLLSENELAAALGMSRTPIRAAISLLETEGFLESVRGRGVFVKEISFREFREMFEMLVSMQLFVLDVAASRGLAFDLPALRAQLEKQAAAAESGDNAAYYESSLAFVGTLVASCGNASMLQLLETIRGKYVFKMLSFRKMNARSIPKPTHARGANARIYAALEKGDLAEARQAVLDLNQFVYDQFSVFDI